MCSQHRKSEMGVLTGVINLPNYFFLPIFQKSKLKNEIIFVRVFVICVKSRKKKHTVFHARICFFVHFSDILAVRRKLIRVEGVGAFNGDTSVNKFSECKMMWKTSYVP